MASTVRNIGVAVVGLGMAGSVRVRDLKEKTCGLLLQAVVSRRPVEMEDVTSVTLEEALASQDVEAIIICSENKTHEDYVQRGLESGKHVLVEFPLAKSHQRAQELFQLAEEKGLVLWEENIALLTESHKLVKEKAQNSEIKAVTLSIAGSYNGWIEKFDESGLPFTSGVSSIETMMDVFGSLKVKEASLKMEEHGYTATASLETTAGDKPIEITLSRVNNKERFRKKSAVFEFIDGEVIDIDKIPRSPNAKHGLFMQDLHQFYQAIVDGTDYQTNKQRTLQSLDIVDQIHSHFKQ